MADDGLPPAAPGPVVEDWQAGGFALYVHWPFCASKCPYCDFNSHVSRTIDQKRWLAAYRKEIARAAAETPGRVLGSIFFGGGTPSLMDPSVVHSIIGAARSGWRFANNIEITLEANPGSVERGRFRGYAEAGVNRLSMGVQALRDRDLQRLGRLHTVAEARAAFDIARTSFERVSFDLIYARQDQTRADWARELQEALSMAVDHLSLYQLTVEEGTPFAMRAAAGRLSGLPTDDLAADLYQDTQELCGGAGMAAYEVSNHAAPGSESRHNLVYWRQGDWVGVGPGAHGRVTLGGARTATEALREPGVWLAAVEQGTGELPRSIVSLAEQGLEYLLMALRLGEGMDITRYATLVGACIDESVLEHLASLGLVEQRDGRLMVTSAGRPILNAVLRALV